MKYHQLARPRTTRTPRSTCFVQNGRVELVWGAQRVQLRRADLVALHRTLRWWQVDGEPDPTLPYVVAVDGCRIWVKPGEMPRFCALVATAAAKLPRTFVRWTDPTIAIVPFTTELERESGLYSLN